MNTHPAAIYLRPRNDIETRLKLVLARSSAAWQPHQPAIVWFRADDIGVPGHQFERMLAIFNAHQVPLAPALVPTWLTAPRWKQLQARGRAGARLWGWHQHGWRHQNHEIHGKKQEFGPARKTTAIRADLERGRHRLEALLDKAFHPLFTPPWNRCSAEALQQLQALDFRAVSRSRGAKPVAAAGFPDLQVNVDLHTRKARSARADWDALLSELESALVSGWCGIMLHHQRMNPAAFDFLDILLQHMVNQKNFRMVHLKTLLASPALVPANGTSI